MLATVGHVYYSLMESINQWSLSVFMVDSKMFIFFNFKELIDASGKLYY
jgi:hypothetical protein